jgi:hypothetical protein
MSAAGFLEQAGEAAGLVQGSLELLISRSKGMITTVIGGGRELKVGPHVAANVFVSRLMERESDD